MEHGHEERIEFNKEIAAEFRANEGVCVGPVEGMPMTLVTMTGAKSGREICTPLVYSRDGDDVVIVASWEGSQTHPSWYYNLVANPDVTVELGVDKWQATAQLTNGEERQRLYDAQTEIMPFFADYAALASPREIPVFRLTRS